MSGLFCPGQKVAGCFSDSDCVRIDEVGQPGGSLLPIGTSHPVTLASVFCIPASGSIPIDGSAALPGPGATSLPATVRLLQSAQAAVTWPEIGAERAARAAAGVPSPPGNAVASTGLGW